MDGTVRSRIFCLVKPPIPVYNIFTEYKGDEMIWNREAECESVEQRRLLQGYNLRKQVAHLYENVAFYRKKMNDLGVTPGDINCIEDIAKLPFTTKDELRETYPYGLLACPERILWRSILLREQREPPFWEVIPGTILICGARLWPGA